MANLVREAARLYPRKNALLDGRCCYTFRELEILSTNFAAFLLSSGVQKGDRIVFYSPKSAPLIVAIIGCWKAGAIYVPVDCRLPKDRLLFILNDVSPRFILSTLQRFEAITPELSIPPNLINEDCLLEHFQFGSEGVSLPSIAKEDVAYCIYTSGSTGRPKGVQIQHSSVDVFFRAFAEVMTIGPDSRCMNTSELYFDVHVMDLFFPLHRGATVHLYCGPMIANKLLQTIEENRITHFTAVGPVMTLMTEGDRFDKCDVSSVVRIMTGAEIINVATMQKWMQKVPGLTIVNGYGPTEATVICTYYLIQEIEPNRKQFYPIGQPMRGTEVLLHDGNRIISGPGVKGELLIGGPQVMKGYWNDEQQTANRIVNIAGKRYYRSGDVCQWLPDGNLDFIGRTDEEVKISGFRINLSEIKRVMDAAENVREGHALVAIHPTLGKVIAGCFTRAEGDIADEDFSGYLQGVFKRELPYYMVPSLYFLFDQFPKLPSGKTDKKEILNRVNYYMGNSANKGMTRFICYEEAVVNDAVEL
ncbi:MAG TPA: amino acid adenylation domain-containing protein [Candidatus Angelobacter sp.]|nr:amino acid adenylation domain-containing protein [Candidatus Angelobacter sp.]